MWDVNDRLNYSKRDICPFIITLVERREGGGGLLLFPFTGYLKYENISELTTERDTSCLAYVMSHVPVIERSCQFG